MAVSLLLKLKFAFIILRNEEKIIAIDHPPEFKLLESRKDNHFGYWLIIDGSVIKN